MDTVTTSASLLEILPALETRPKPVAVDYNSNGKNGTTLRSVTPLTDKEKVSQILASLEDVRLNLADSSGQGFLFNAAAGLQLFLNI